MQRGVRIEVGGLPERALNQAAARQLIGSEALVVVDEYCRVVLERVRHEYPVQLGVLQGESGRLLAGGARHEMGIDRAPT